MSKLTEQLRNIAHELSNSNAELLEKAALRIEELERKAAHNSWAGEVDRQGGGFTQDEINGFDGWGRN
jgi:hypothetical protein